jgi:acetyl-CoA synthetase
MIWVSDKGGSGCFTFGDIMRYSSKAANYFVSLGIKKATG